MRVVITNNHSMLNAGDHMILRETVRMLREADPGAEIDLIFNEPASGQAAFPNTRIHASPVSWVASRRPDGSYALAGRTARWGYLALLVLSALWFRATSRAFFPFLDARKRGLLRALARADLVLVCGGGNFYTPHAFDGLTGWFGFTLSCCAVALLMGKPLALLPQSIGPFHSNSQRRAMAAIIRRARLTCVRERASLRLLEELGCAQRALCLPDMAFGAQVDAVEEARALLERTGALQQEAAFRVGMSLLNWGDQYAQFRGQNSYESAVLACIDAITAQGGQVVLFAQCCGPSAAEDDRRTGARIYAQVADPARVHVVMEEVAPDVLQAAYAGMDYFIGTRMHAVILALNAGTPALAIGYLHKTRGVLEELGMRERCLDIATISAEQLLAAFEQLRRDATRDPAAPYLRHARRAKHALGRILASIVQQPAHPIALDSLAIEQDAP
jgi:colanic acid/amylovoran biosynthesis protein